MITFFALELASGGQEKLFKFLPMNGPNLWHEPLGKYRRADGN